MTSLWRWSEIVGWRILRAIYGYIRSALLVANPAKFQIIFFGISIPQELSVSGANIIETEIVKLFILQIDNKLSF